MTRAELLQRFSEFTTWKSGTERAPHKPLLILYALGCLSNGQFSIPYRDVDKSLTQLLRDFGPPRKTYQPIQPFWRLQRDGLWEVTASGPVPVSSEGTPTKGDLTRLDAKGQFPDPIQSALRGDPDSIPAVAELILKAHFPDSVHDDIADAVGLDLSAAQRPPGGGRDPNFRKRVLSSYEYRCAVCDFQLLLSGLPVGLEAAHIKWHQAAGPGVVPNGICMCPLHHRLFDLGAFTIDQSFMILFSDEAAATTDQSRHVQSLHGSKLRLPIHKEDEPKLEYLSWHLSEVFRGRARPIAE